MPSRKYTPPSAPPQLHLKSLIFQWAHFSSLNSREKKNIGSSSPRLQGLLALQMLMKGGESSTRRTGDTPVPSRHHTSSLAGISHTHTCAGMHTHPHTTYTHAHPHRVHFQLGSMTGTVSSETDWINTGVIQDTDGSAAPGRL